MGRAYTRDELIVEAAASGKLREVSSNGDVRRFTDDRVFRCPGTFGAFGQLC